MDKNPSIKKFTTVSVFSFPTTSKIQNIIEIKKLAMVQINPTLIEVARPLIVLRYISLPA